MITYYRTRLAGQYVAICSDCRFTCAYWDDVEELEHTCAEYCTHNWVWNDENEETMLCTECRSIQR